MFADPYVTLGRQRGGIRAELGLKQEEEEVLMYTRLEAGLPVTKNLSTLSK